MAGGVLVMEFPDGVFHHFPGFTGPFLNAAHQFVLLSIEILQIIIREPGPLLFELALDDVPVPFDFECCHRRPDTPAGRSLLWGETLPLPAAAVCAAGQPETGRESGAFEDRLHPGRLHGPVALDGCHSATSPAADEAIGRTGAAGRVNARAPVVH